MLVTKLVLNNLPPAYKEPIIKDFVEGTLDVDVKSVDVKVALPGKALITFKCEIDFLEASESLKETAIENKVVDVQPAEIDPFRVVVSDVKAEYLSQEFLEIYFCAEFGDGEDIVTSCQMYETFDMAVVTFHEISEVMGFILACKDHIPLPSENYHILVEPFYLHFHGCLEEQLTKDFQGLPPSLDCMVEKTKKENQVNRMTDFSNAKAEGAWSSTEDDEDMEELPPLKENYYTDVHGLKITQERKELRTCAIDVVTKEEPEQEERMWKQAERYGSRKVATPRDTVRGRGGIRGLQGQPYSKKSNRAVDNSLDEENETEYFDVSNGKYFVNPTGRGRGKARARGRGNSRGRGRGRLDSYTSRCNVPEVMEIKTDPKDLPCFIEDSVLLSKVSSDYKHLNQFHGNPRGKGRGFASTRGIAKPDGYTSKCNVPEVMEIKTDPKDLPFMTENLHAYPARRGRGYASARGRAKPESHEAMEINSHSHDLHRMTENKSHGRSADLFDSVSDCLNTTNNFARHSRGETMYTDDLLEKDKKIKEMEEKLKNLESEKQRKDKQVERKEHVTKVQALLLKECFGTFGECKLTYDMINECAIFEGHEESVIERHLYLLSELKKLKEDSIELNNAMNVILSRFWQQPCLDKLKKLVSTLKGEVIFENCSLNIVAYGEDNLESAMDLIKDQINGCKNIPIEGSISEKEFQHLKAHTESKFPVIVSLNKEIELHGMKEDVENAASDIKAILTDLQSLSELIEIKTSLAGYFNQILMKKIGTILQEVKVIEQERSDSKVSFTLCGTKSRIRDAKKTLNDLISTIQSKSWDLGRELKKKENVMLVANSSTLLDFFISDFQIKNQCYVLPKIPKVIPTPSRPHQPIKGRKKEVPKTRSQHQPRSFVEEEENLTFSLTSTCQLIIQPYGTITQENSAVLVCVLGEKADLRGTRVGIAFNRACSTLWKSLNEARQSVLQNPSVVVTQGPFKGLPGSCQAVYHVILPKYSPGISENNLTEAVKTLLNYATKAGLTSISIPPLGCGRALGYPTSAVAQIVMQTLQSSVAQAQSSLKKVVLLAMDSSLMADYKSAAAKHFSLSSPLKQNSAGNEEDSSATFGRDNDFSETDGSDSSDEDFEIITPPDFDAPGTVTIWTEQQHKLDALWSGLKEIIIQHLLHEAQFSQTELTHWPKAFHKKIIEAAKQRSVWVESFENSKTKKAGFRVKGEKRATEQFMEIIRIEHQHLLDKMPKKIFSERAPKRGTLDFVRHASSCNELFPSYWELNKKETDSPGFFSKNWNKLRQKFLDQSSNSVLAKVNTRTQAAIEKLVTSLFDTHLVGVGQDAVNLAHRNIQVLSVKRVENPVQFELYNVNRKRLFGKCSQRQSLCKDIGQISGSKGRVASTETLPSFMKEELYWEVNEHYLFHGSSAFDTLITSGADPRLGNTGGMFGKGFYLAERSTKADQYADDRRNRTAPGQTLTMIMYRALLGDVFLCNDRHESVQSKDSIKLNRPPCMTCKKDKCQGHLQVLYDSVMGDGKWNFREFVLYDQHRCYPEYVIHYKRV